MDNFGYVMATDMLVKNRRKVRFMYRETPANQYDSGWRFFCGDEDAKYMDVPNNINIYHINTILSFDNSILPCLDNGIGIAFEWNDDTACFIETKDFFSGVK